MIGTYPNRAIVSVTNKEGIGEFCLNLEKRGFGNFSTGGTATIIRQAGGIVTDISEYTGFPEGMDGRLKTIHPMVEGGMLGRLDKQHHVEFQTAHGIFVFPLVVVNLYDFAGTIANPDVLFDDAVEQIDIGGPTMIRAAAKNWRYCLPVVDPADYPEVLKQIDEYGTDFEIAFRRRMMLKAFRMTGEYDTKIADWIESQPI